MAPLSQALQVSFQSQSDDDHSFCYHCDLDPSWAVVAGHTIPEYLMEVGLLANFIWVDRFEYLASGRLGYALGVVVEACIRHQSAVGSSHADPIYVSAHFLRATNVGIGQVRLKLLKSGKTFTNITAELVQKGKTKIMAHLLFGDLSPSPPGPERRVLEPPSPYARRVPLHSHPSAAHPTPGTPFWAEKMGIRVSVDAVTSSQNHPSSPTRTTAKSVGGGGVMWGAWSELTLEGDKLITSSIPFFCDFFVSLPDLLPKNEPGSTKVTSWYPTIVMTVEFKTRIPSSDKHSVRTVGILYESRFQSDPEGRHNARVEVWTAPSEIGRGSITKGWRDGQYCIAVADQMSLMLPEEVNMRQGTKDSAKL